MNRIWAPLVLSLLIALAPQGPAIRGAEESSGDIPGTIWSGGRATGSVGGPIFDRVWRLVLPEARVAIVQLQGSAGAELGLYLFDSTATSVTTAVPMKKSAQPGGSQRFAAPLPAGTYYLNVNGRNVDRAYGFTLTVALILDPTPPFISVSIAEGASRVSSTTISVGVNATDSLSGVEQVRMRVDDGEWAAWQPYSRTLLATLEAREGEHSVAVQVSNGAGLLSPVARDTVTLDLTSPVGTLLSPSISSTISVSKPTIRYQFSEPLKRSTWNGSAISIQDASGNVIRGTGSYDPKTKIGTYNVSDPLTPGVEYVVQEGGARDRAGNLITIDPWVLWYRVRPRITLTQSQITAVGSSPVRIVYRTESIPAGTELLLERLVEGPEGATWESAGQARVEAGADLQRVTFAPQQSGTYHLRFIGSATRLPVVSGRLRVTLAPRIVVVGILDVRRAAVGSTQTLSFRVFPASVSDLALVRSKCNASFTSCTVTERIPVSPNSDGTVSYNWTATPGNWSWRLRTPSNSLHREARSALIRYTVR